MERAHDEGHGGWPCAVKTLLAAWAVVVARLRDEPAGTDRSSPPDSQRLVKVMRPICKGGGVGPGGGWRLPRRCRCKWPVLPFGGYRSVNAQRA